MDISENPQKKSGQGFEYFRRIDRARTIFVGKYTSRGSRGTILGRIGRVENAHNLF